MSDRNGDILEPDGVILPDGPLPFRDANGKQIGTATYEKTEKGIRCVIHNETNEPFRVPSFAVTREPDGSLRLRNGCDIIQMDRIRPASLPVGEWVEVPGISAYLIPKEDKPASDDPVLGEEV